MQDEATETRRFGLADVMILVVATAVGLAPLKFNLEVAKILPPPATGWGSAVIHYTNLTVIFVASLLVSWTAASLTLTARRPRRRLVGQPGAMLCLAALVGTCHAAAYHLGVFRKFGLGQSNMGLMSFWSDVVDDAGMAVLGAWVALLCSGLALRPAGWPDRLGRAISFVWIALLLAICSRWWWIALETLF